MHIGASQVGKFFTALRSAQVWPLVLMVLGCLLSLGAVTASRIHYQFGVNAIDAIQAGKAQVERLDWLLQLMVDEETGVRGYLLTRNDNYLNPFRASEASLDGLLGMIEADYPPGDPGHAEFIAMRGFIKEKRSNLATAMKSGHLIPPQRSTELDKELMDQIRLSVSTLREYTVTAEAKLELRSEQRLNFIQKVVTVFTIGSLALMVILFAVQLRQTWARLREQDQLEHENSKLESTVMRRTRELSDLATYLTNAREDERAHLARELHDELGALLTAAKMDASWLLRKLGATAEPGIADRFRRLIDSLGASINIKRRIIDNLCPALLQGLGLSDALSTLARTFSVEVPVSVRLPAGDPPTTEDQSLALFRIAQEALTNIRKYAQAKHVELGLTVDDGNIRLWVEDDGIGFDVDSPKINRHGLAGMKHRTYMLRGELVVRSTPGQGTRIEAIIPLQHALP